MNAWNLLNIKQDITNISIIIKAKDYTNLLLFLKLKNTSDKPLKDEITVTGVFTSDDEEWSNGSFYFQRTWENPLQPGLARQISIKSDVGWTNPAGVGRANISCQLLINGNVYKTVKIANKFLYSNRI